VALNRARGDLQPVRPDAAALATALAQADQSVADARSKLREVGEG
jgi:hypothetical protein